jgi:hypothetical protein
LDAIILDITFLELVSLTCHKALLALLALDRELGPELDLAGTTLRQFV